MGSYLLLFKLDGYQEVCYPLLMTRSGRFDLTVRLPTEEEVGEGFCFVPAGPFPLESEDDWRPGHSRLRFVKDFCIATYPVTFGEYLEFINDILPSHPDEAISHLPQSPDRAVAYVTLDENGRYRPSLQLIQGAARKRYPIGEGFEECLPVVGVNWYDAQAYLLWRSRREGIPYRLPTNIDWAKACRSLDERLYP